MLGELSCEALQIMRTALSVSSEILPSRIKELAEKVSMLAIHTENQAFLILSLQQPLLKDLRLVIGVLKISHQFTRIVNYCIRLVDLSESHTDRDTVPAEFLALGENCQSMLKDVITSFKLGSTEMAAQLANKDHENDVLHDTSFQKVLRKIQTTNVGEGVPIEISANLLTMMRLLERTGDIIAVIAKEVYFMYSGQRL